ncbi:DUF1513 domain-containing protein [Azospirillum sp. RWY-5-1]|uniref:DUF1513 domain-containing protein n=2 Tax=Azospirillum oleiclasticum TaxID=2735135 RepID=A0ABX2T953_9PROT|nr:DUF1513 domain-containing protein [Azospirillum oleiclasticum]NYZ19733.1 DUF1513 domain-containing protein [Azospirillum oleiclasticum]
MAIDPMATDLIRLTRRGLLAGAGGGLALTLLNPAPLRAGGQGPLYLSAYATAGQPAGYGVAGLRPDGTLAFTRELPGRAHAVVPRPGAAQAVVFARRPGRWLAPLNLATGALGAVVAVPDGFRFTGHGAFDRDGRILYVAEDDVEAEAGSIGIYDPRDGYRRTGALPAHGLGPHELLALEGGRVLVVANGGVITHPDTGRAKLNVDEMDASITYVEAATGALLEKVRLPEDFSNLGIRHIAAMADGAVAFGAQDERPTGDVQPLVGLHRRGSQPLLFDAPEGVWARFDGYIGSVASDGRVVAASSPRGGVVGFWDGRDGRWLGLAELPDGCGIAPAEGGFEATNGLGAVGTFTVAGTPADPPHATPGYRWDNHLTPVG